jgi:hypothetical protein
MHPAADIPHHQNTLINLLYDVTVSDFCRQVEAREIELFVWSPLVEPKPATTRNTVPQTVNRGRRRVGLCRFEWCTPSEVASAAGVAGRVSTGRYHAFHLIMGSQFTITLNFFGCRGHLHPGRIRAAGSSVPVVLFTRGG